MTKPYRPYPPGQAWDEAWHQRLRAERYWRALRLVVEAYTEFRHMTSFDLAYKLKELAEKGLGEDDTDRQPFCRRQEKDWRIFND